MNRTHASRGLARIIALILAMVAVGLAPLTLTNVASAAAGDVGQEGPRYGTPIDPDPITGKYPFIDPDNSPTATKPQSKLWYAQGQWWGVLLSKSASAFHIYSFDADTKSWVDTGVLVDTRSESHVDVLWDGTHLFTVGAVYRTSATPADNAIKFNSYSYSDVKGKYVVDVSNKTLNGGGVEAAVLAKDGHGRLWVAYTAANNVRYVTSDDLGATFTGPTPLPAAFAAQSEGLDPDDIATVIGASDSASIAWSRQGAAPGHIDGLYVATYKYDSSTGTAGAWKLDTLLDQAYAADDHINMSIDGDGAGRVFLVAKEGTNDNPSVLGTDTLIRLWVRDLTGHWTSYVVNKVADFVTRPIVVVDKDANLLRVFETSPEAGGAIYQKTTSLSSPSNFATGLGTPVIKLNNDTFINNVTTTKQNVTKGTGLLLLASDQRAARYVYNADAVPTPSHASFTFAPSSGYAPLSVSFTNTSTNAATYLWTFGDGGTSTEKSPTHVYTTPGSYTVMLEAKNAAGNPSSKTATVTVSAPLPVAGFTYAPQSGTAPLAVTFTNTSTSATGATWSWDFGDGSAKATTKDASHTFTKAGTYTVKLTATTAGGSSSKTGTVTVSAPPVPVTPPVVSLTPLAMFDSSATVSAAWSQTGGSPATAYDVEISSVGYNGTKWATSVGRTAAKGVSFTGAKGSTYCFRVRGVNASGVVGSYSSATCTAVPLDDRNLSRSSKWRALSSKSGYLGTVMRTSAKGAAMAKTVTGKHVSLIVTKSRGAGRVNVYRGSRLVKRISLASSTTRARQFVSIGNYSTVTKSAFRFVVVTKGKPVTIDGLAVSRN